MSYLLYHSLKTLYPGSKDFLDMGLGISARYARCESYWRRHLDNSKNFQLAAIERLCDTSDWGGRIAVLGSGRLFDVPLRELLPNSKSIALYDADPSAILSNRLSVFQGRSKLSFHCTELTGSLQSWSDRLAAFLQAERSVRSIEKLVEFIKTLKVENPVTLSGYDLVISLNLLSQIPLYWRDRVFSAIWKFWQLEIDEDSCDPDLMQALNGVMQLLQRDHLRLIAAAASRKVVLITDSHFNYYQRDKSAWLVHDALLVNPAEELQASFVPEHSKCWLWHIAPQGIEQESYGVIHRVEATSFARSLLCPDSRLINNNRAPAL